jgi:hypothetical protein
VLFVSFVVEIDDEESGTGGRYTTKNAKDTKNEGKAV